MKDILKLYCHRIFGDSIANIFGSTTRSLAESAMANDDEVNKALQSMVMVEVGPDELSESDYDEDDSDEDDLLSGEEDDDVSSPPVLSLSCSACSQTHRPCKSGSNAR